MRGQRRGRRCFRDQPAQRGEALRANTCPLPEARGLSAPNIISTLSDEASRQATSAPAETTSRALFFVTDTRRSVFHRRVTEGHYITLCFVLFCSAPVQIVKKKGTFCGKGPIQPVSLFQAEPLGLQHPASVLPPPARQRRPLEGT